ncbi:MFS transporter [Conexibacter sp. SYSU D00693]|uniref:MFS transporter n=1 Tax=Conexibacter sp. SYSU D00693 TaxID=2812560 RepID=UPI00196AE1D9|nr:MFS transporter [Conexibacter sp. SYSU D00693]
MSPDLAARPHPGRSLLILATGAMAFALAQSALVPAMGSLTREFDTDASGVAWLLTGYLVAAAVATPVMGRLGDMFGKRRLLVVSLLVFAAGNVLSGIGSTLELVVAGRVLQGVGGGVFPLAMGIIRDEFPRERVGTGIGMISAIAGIGGGLGIVLGGVLVDEVSYHWIFWVGAATATLAALCTALFIPESPHRTPARVDVRGALVLGLGLVLPLIGISEANRWGWGDPGTLALIVAGAVVLAGWVALQRRTAEPLADLDALASRPVLLTNVTTLLVGFGMFGSFVLIPQLVSTPESSGYGFGLDATGAGLLMLPGSLLMLVTGPLSGVLATRAGPKVPLALGGITCAVGLTLLALSHGSRLEVLLWGAVNSAGIGLAFAAMPNLIIEAVPQAQTGEATGFNALVRSVGASLGSQVAAAVLTGSVLASTALPSEDGYRNAFLLCAGFSVLAAAVATVIPRGAHRHQVAPLEEVGAAAPLGEPVAAGR